MLGIAKKSKGRARKDKQGMNSAKTKAPKAKKSKETSAKAVKAKENAKPPVKEKKKPAEEKKKEKTIEKYGFNADKIPVRVMISDEGDYVYHYRIFLPEVSQTTRVVMNNVKAGLVENIEIGAREILDTKLFAELRKKFRDNAGDALESELPHLEEDVKEMLSSMIVNEMVGLGELEIFLADDNLEEVVVNSSRDPIWVYTKNYGWLKSNVVIPSEEDIQNLASRIARQVSREITSASPMLDAHLVSGDRANSTLFPVSTEGNTITIRRFSRIPWTITQLLETKTLNAELASMLWLAIEYELSMLVSGGTASGKTSVLNALMPFIQPNHRIISIEDTRELNLPSFLQWVPMSTRPPNPRGEGGVSMLDLMENSLRMRPDRIIVGEVRRKREAEVLFEAMHTGHSVYGTFHADSADELIKRFTNPPIDVPKTVMESLHLILVQYRNRRLGFRRTFELAEVLRTEGDEPKTNTLFRWSAKSDTIKKDRWSERLFGEVGLHSGLNRNELTKDLDEKVEVLNWLVKKGIKDVENVGRVSSAYYKDRDIVLKTARKGGDVKDLERI